MQVGNDEVRALALFVQVHDLYTYFGRLPMRLTREGPAAAALLRLNPATAARIVTELTLQRDISRVPAVHLWEDFGEVFVAADDTASFQADGEHLGRARTLTIEPRPGALHILRP